jgi:hypothetical protein
MDFFETKIPHTENMSKKWDLLSEFPRSSISCVPTKNYIRTNEWCRPPK